MGNPSSGSKVQVSMSLSKGRHRQSLSVASLQLEKLAQQERSTPTEKPATGTLSPRAAEEKSIAAFLGDKKTKRRTRSSLGGTEDFIKGLELNGVPLLTEERKPLSLIPFRGHRRVRSGNVTPSKSLESPRAKGTNTPPGKEKYAVAKIAASLFHSPTKLERSMSLSRVAHRAIPDAEGTPRCRPGLAVGEVILPGMRDKVVEYKRKELQLGSESGSQPAVGHTLESDAGCPPSISKIGAHQVVGKGEHLQTQITSVPMVGVLNRSRCTTDCADSDATLEHLNMKAAEMTENPLTTARLTETPPVLKTRGELRASHASNAVDAAHSIEGIAMESPLTISHISSSSEISSPLELEMVQKPANEFDSTPTSLSDQPQLTCENSVCPHVHLQESAINTQDLPSNLCPFCGETSPIFEKVHPCGTIGNNPVPDPSSEKPLVAKPSNLDSEKLVELVVVPKDLNPLTVDVTQIKEVSKDAQLLSCSPEKVTEEELTEAAFLSSLVCEDGSAGPVLISEESKQFPVHSSEGGSLKVVRLSLDGEIGMMSTSQPSACLTKSISFEPGLGDKSVNDVERRSKLRKRRRSVSASGIGAMLLKVVRVSDSGPAVTRTKVGPEVSVVDPFRAGEYVVHKTAQINIGQSESPTSAHHEIKATGAETIDMELDSGELVSPDLHRCVDYNGVSGRKDSEGQSEEVGLQPFGLRELAGDTQVKGITQGVQLEDSGGSQSISTGQTQSIEQHDQAQKLSQRTSIHMHDLGVAAVNSIRTSTEKNLHQGELEESFLDAGETQFKLDEPNLTNKGAIEAALEEKNYDGQDVPAPAITKLSVPLASAKLSVEDTRGSRRRHSKGRISYDMDKSTDPLNHGAHGHGLGNVGKPSMSGEWQSKKLDSTEESSGLGQAQTTISTSKQALSLLDENVAITKDTPRCFASMLQVSPRQSLDEYRLAPSSMSILANPSFSSSHQDRLWEEQAEAYSSGGRGTPGREDEAAPNVFLHSPSPGGAISSDDQVHSASGSLRKSDSSLVVASGVSGEKGRSLDKKKGQSKKRVRPRTPLRSLLAEDTHSKGSGSGNRSPESGRFLHNIMSRIRGNSSKSLSPKSPEATPKRRNTLWSSCICFSTK